MANRRDLEALRMANVQRKRASLDMLSRKRRVERDVVVLVPGDDGPEEWTFLFRAIGAQEYDNLMTKYPPNAEQRKEGLAYDIDRFAPRLLSMVCIDPDLSEEQAAEMWNSPDWNRGELMTLFLNAVQVCTQGQDVSPTEGD